MVINWVESNLYGNHMISSAIWDKSVFQRLTKLHESVVRVQVFVWKITSGDLSQIGRDY